MPAASVSSPAPFPVAFCAPGVDPEPWAEGLRQALPQAELQPWTPGAPGVAACALVWNPPQRFIDEQPQLQGLFNLGAGVDALLRLRLPAHLQVVRVEDAGMAVQMAEYACHALIGAFRDFDGLRQAQSRGVWANPPAPHRADYPVGVLGMGVLGRRVAQALRAFEFPVHAWTRTPPVDPPQGVQCHVGEAALDAFLGHCRGLVCLLPLTPATQDLLNRQRLSRLLPGAHVVNVARGALVVDEDLIALLDEGHLAGATLDVFRQEPLPVGHPFWTHPRIRITPHTSARTLRHESIAQIAAKIARLAAGEPWSALSGRVDLQRGY